MHHRIFHFEPYELHWHPPHKDVDTRIYGELFTSRVFLEAHQQLQESTPEPGCNLPRRIVALMFWSDSTQLTSLGSAKLWPLYAYFGNESKYMRGKPSAQLCTHIAYFQTLLDEFKDFATEHMGNTPSDPFFAHCHRELFHAQWQELLDNDFVQAYAHGITLRGCDSVDRRLYPCIFTYSADYPEKVLIANIRNLGGCPCPLYGTSLIATGQDMLRRELLACNDTQECRDKVSNARKLIYEQNYAVDSKVVEDILKNESLVPIMNAFLARLSHTGFDFFQMLVIDILHEFELGVWKAIFIHLLRILECLRYEVGKASAAY
ncbi:hypothetical protein BDN67DRAFT_992731 [Paxillus ammoniavirescens]|nr:hypothetical protein BDN67DRAFT_992731 [Paxillus ammoniavirescens]